jgi:hypothetical protein
MTMKDNMKFSILEVKTARPMNGTRDKIITNGAAVVATALDFAQQRLAAIVPGDAPGNSRPSEPL